MIYGTVGWQEIILVVVILLGILLWQWAKGGEE